MTTILVFAGRLFNQCQSTAFGALPCRVEDHPIRGIGILALDEDKEDGPDDQEAQNHQGDEAYPDYDAGRDGHKLRVKETLHLLGDLDIRIEGSTELLSHISESC
ncbi:MAG: hypothetical protein GX819_05500 [Clostridiaceae bacterium]|nr:hypothetical protein [Clostridiaceae bacterium]